jgi:16S rRNA processing protein RimM
MGEKPRHLAIGQIVQAHGLRGELSVLALTEHDERFAPGAKVHLSRTPEGDEGLTQFTIVSARRHKERVLLLLERIDDRTQAEWYVGAYLVIPYEEAEAVRDEDEFFLHALVGREVRSEHGERLGTVIDVLETGGAALLEIEGDWAGRRMLPFVKEFVRAVEKDAVVVTPPEGWEEI